MRVGSENSIYSLFVPKPRKSPSIGDDFKTAEPPKAPSIRSDGELVADFYARMARQQVEGSDADHDGQVTKDEYMVAQQRLAEANDKQFDKDAAEARWSKLDATGKGWANEDDILQGLKTMLTVKVGHLDAGYAAALRNRPPGK